MAVAETKKSNSGKENALQLKYIRIVRMFLWFIGAWPGEILGEKVPLFIKYHRIQIPIHTGVVVLGQLYYLYNKYEVITFFDIGHVYITTFLATVTLVRAALPSMKTYCEITKVFINKFHLLHYKNKGQYYKKINDTVDKASYYFTLYQMALMIFGMFLFNLSPMYNNFRIGAFSDRQSVNTSLEFAVFFAFPGFDQEDHFLLMTGINFYLSYICATAVCSIDLLLFVMVFQILGHIAIMRHNLQAIPRPTAAVPADKTKTVKLTEPLQQYGQRENETQRLNIIEIIEHLKEINRFVDNISNFFGPMLAINYLFHLVSGCVLLLECSRLELNALLRFGPLTIIIFGQLVQVSIVFEMVHAMSRTLGDTVYAVPWESMSVDNQRCLRLLLQKVQTPIQLTAMGIVPVGVQTMGSILKTTLSYFVFLRQKNNG